MARMILQNDNVFGGNLKRLRKARGLTQVDVIRELNLLGSTTLRESYVRIEAGTRNIKMTDIVALQMVLGCDYADFFDGVGTC